MSLSADTRELLERLNRLWRVAGAPPARAALPGTLVYRVRLALAKLLAPQETFNAAVVEYINTTAVALDQARAAAEDAVRYRESLAARERRIETAANAILAEHEEIRTSLGQLHQATQALRREMSRMTAAAGAVPPVEQVAPIPPAVGAGATFGSEVDAHQYVGFEDRFRGAADDIRERLRDYVPIFAGAADVVDVGCGRGEFLKLLREQGVRARGVDVNPAMVSACVDQGLDAVKGDALGFLAAQPPGSLGGLFAAQVIEHLEPAYLLRFLSAAFEALRPGAPIVLETINPACWFAFFSSYIRDITHEQPVHPDTLQFLLVAAGFQRVDIQYRAPYPAQDKLQPVESTPALEAWAATLNENADKLNRLLFTHLDYAAVGYRP